MYEITAIEHLYHRIIDCQPHKPDKGRYQHYYEHTHSKQRVRIVKVANDDFSESIEIEFIHCRFIFWTLTLTLTLTSDTNAAAS